MSCLNYVSPGLLSIRKLEGQSYVGLRPTTNRRLVRAACRIKLSHPVSVIRANDDREASVKSSGMSIEECEAAVVAGNAPQAPPPRPTPAAPAGTPVVSSLVRSGLQFSFVALN